MLEPSTNKKRKYDSKDNSNNSDLSRGRAISMAGRAPIPRGMQHAIRAADCEMRAIITFSTPEAAARETRQSSISYSPLTKFIRTQLSYHRKSRRAVLLRPRGLPQAARSTRGICPDLHGRESSRHLQQITDHPRHAPMAGPAVAQPWSWYGPGDENSRGGRITLHLIFSSCPSDMAFSPACSFRRSVSSSPASSIDR